MEKNLNGQLFEEFESKMNQLFENESYDEVLQLIRNTLPNILKITDVIIFKQYAALLAENAGEHQSFEYLQLLLNEGIKRKLITIEEMDMYIQIAPANRWL